MTSQQRRTLMRMLRQAKAGDELACEQLTDTLSRLYAYMIRGFHSADPAFDDDDLRERFQLGIWQAIPKVDGRGDPLFHLAWRGQRAVCHELRVIKRRRTGTPAYVREFGERSVGALPEEWDPPADRQDYDPEYVLRVREDRDEAHRHVVNVLARVSLTDRQRQVVQWALSDPDPQEPGANRRLAAHLATSEQYASLQRRRTFGRLEQELSADGVSV